MRYESYEEIAGKPIEKLVFDKLEEIEEKENVKVLHAVESGSRAWGFASPDSDYDIRFVYVRPMEYYLGLGSKQDFIDWELSETLDINGWDLSKVLQHFHKSNATMYEWANSPIVYKTTAEWERIMKTAAQYFSSKSAIYHYYGTATKNYTKYLGDDRVKYKKYFYVLRPILACQWIEKKACPPPVLFKELVNEALEEDMKPIVEKLLEEKLKMRESDKGARIDRVNNYIQKHLQYYKKRLAEMQEDKKEGWEEINQLFIRLLTRQAEK